MRLRTKLLALLLAFGVVPLAASIIVGFSVSRIIITRQVQRALRELTEQQAVHLGAEVSRERLLLRTIAARLPPLPTLARSAPATASRELIPSLPEGGVFDGLRVVTAQRTAASVSLRPAAAHWPDSAPAADWSRTAVLVHRVESQVFAYLLAVPAGERNEGAWLEGHVRAADFRLVLGMPEHLMTGVESAVFERSGEPVFVAHAHAARDMVAAFGVLDGDTARVVSATIDGTRSLVVAAPIAPTNWVLVSVLPLQVALAPLARLRDTAIVGALALIILIVVIGIFAARSVTAPLHDLGVAARNLGRAGSYSPIAQQRADEVGELVGAFNRMAQDLEESRRNIDRFHAEELARAQQLATVGELASGVAHEIRNPVTGVLGALDLALRKLSTSDPLQPLLEEARRQLKRIEATTAQLLRYARPPEPREVVVDANLLADRATQVVEGQARAAGITLNSEPARVPVPVNVDPELLVQVLVNLMLNGIQAMPTGGHVTVWVNRRTPEVWIGVRDTGPGVPREQRAEIFRPFYTTKHQGTGLGLPISQQIVTRHGGTLRLEDTPGGGATFVVALPLAGDREARDGRA